MNIKVRKLNIQATLPSYQTDGASGLDLVACIDSDITLKPHERYLVPTGLAFEIPVGLEAQVRGRSSLALKYGIMPANGIGTIDSDYRGELGVILLNTSNDNFVIQPGMRIAQLVFIRFEKAELTEVEILNGTKRGEGGFGSTGA